MSKNCFAKTKVVPVYFLRKVPHGTNRLSNKTDRRDLTQGHNYTTVTLLIHTCGMASKQQLIVEHTSISRLICSFLFVKMSMDYVQKQKSDNFGFCRVRPGHV